jgi:hypothetical protein
MTVLWLPISHSAHAMTPLAEFQALCDPREPLDSLGGPEWNRRLVEAADQIARAARRAVPPR